jgi:hypothetical protein
LRCTDSREGFAVSLRRLTPESPITDLPDGASPSVKNISVYQ